VSTLVNDAREEGPELVEPVADETDEAAAAKDPGEARLF
jgi:hypothetical protein